MIGIEENVKKPDFWHLIPLDPRIRIFQNSGCVTFFTLLTLNFMQSFRKNLMSDLRHIQRWTDRLMG